MAPLVFNPAVVFSADFYLLSGTVTINGVPVNGCQVSAWEASGAQQGNNAYTDSNGHYQMPLFPGTYNVWVQGTIYDYWGGTYTSFNIPLGYQAAQNLVISDAATLNIPITTYKLTGRVMDTNGQGIPNAMLSVSSEWSPYWTSSSVSAADGSYKLFVYPGTYTIGVRPPDGTLFGVTMIRVDISGDSARDITLEEQLLLSGTVTINGVPVNGCQVSAWEASGAQQGNSAYTDSNGHYQLPLFPGTYNVWVQGMVYEYWGGTYTSFNIPLGYQAAQNLVISGEATLDIPITTYTLTGRVMDTNGRGVPDVAVSTSGGRMQYWTSSTVSSADGSYKLFVLLETYSVGVVAPPMQFPPFTIQKITSTENSMRDIVLSYDYAALEGALASIPPGLELHQDIFAIIDQSATTVYDVPITSPRDLMTLIPNWGGSELAVSVFRPDGSFYGTYQSTHPPIIVNIPDPEVGTWRCEVTAIDVPYNNYPIALVAAVARRFSDVVSGYWAYDFIMALSDSSITGGCSDNPPRFCPDIPITRGQMAVFLETSLGNPPNVCTGRFLDVHVTDSFCGYIERLTADGISAGCSADKFCPNDPVTRGQMAVFIEAAIGAASPSPCTETLFGDVTNLSVGPGFCNFIEKLASDGITGGCGNGNFCPDNPVTRAEMAVFLVAAPAPLNP